MRTTYELHDATGRANTLTMTWDDHGLVHVEIIAKHAGDTVVASAVTLPRVLFADAIRVLGVLS